MRRTNPLRDALRRATRVQAGVAATKGDAVRVATDGEEEEGPADRGDVEPAGDDGAEAIARGVVRGPGVGFGGVQEEDLLPIVVVGREHLPSVGEPRDVDGLGGLAVGGPRGRGGVVSGEAVPGEEPQPVMRGPELADVAVWRGDVELVAVEGACSYEMTRAGGGAGPFRGAPRPCVQKLQPRPTLAVGETRPIVSIV